MTTTLQKIKPATGDRGSIRDLVRGETEKGAYPNNTYSYRIVQVQRKGTDWIICIHRYRSSLGVSISHVQRQRRHLNVLTNVLSAHSFLCLFLGFQSFSFDTHSFILLRYATLYNTCITLSTLPYTIPTLHFSHESSACGR